MNDFRPSPDVRVKTPTGPDDVVTLARLGRMLEKNAPAELPLTPYKVLALIARGDARAARIAKKLTLGKPSITAVVGELSRLGFVSGSEVPEDRRGVLLTVTPAGWEALDRSSAHLGQILDDVIDRCDEPAMVHAALKQLGAAVDALKAEQAEANPL